jgi:hypothetical protein
VNDPNLPLLAAAGATGVLAATVARLLPDTIDITFIPAFAAVAAGAGVVLAFVTRTDPVFGARRGAALGAAIAIAIYLAALAGLL